MSPITAKYGTWESRVSSETVVQNSSRFPSVFVDPVTSAIYHLEARPSEDGRCVIVDIATGEDAFGAGWDASTRVGEYGGGAAIAYAGFIYFSNFGDLRVYKLDEANLKDDPVAVTPENKNHRFADFAALPSHPHLLFAVLEDHTNPSPEEVKTSLVLINTSTKAVSPVASGADFYSSLRFSPDGKYAVWKQWYHPNMPWEGTELYVAKVAVNSDEKVEFVEITMVSGVRGQVSASYPFWISKETFVFTNNVSGHRNPWSYSTVTGKPVPILPNPVPMAFSLPSWFLGESYCARLDKKGEDIVYSVIHDGRAHLYRVNLSSGALEKIESPYVEMYSLRRIPRVGVIFVGERGNGPPEIVSLTLDSSNTPSFEIIKSTSPPTTSLFHSGIISVAQPITIDTPNGGVAHLNFYPPTNPKYSGGDGGEKPPCVFGVHGGPTMTSNRALNWHVQYFTSRGWAWVDVNYAGSAGYGKGFIDRLKGQWGVSVTRDCVQAALHLSNANLIDLSRIFIRGRSAGGYSTMVAISNPPADTPPGIKWAGATSIYGISDLKAWADGMHKFQRKYVGWLIGGSYEEIPNVYKERSPITHADKINTPLLLIHGTADAVVPPSQSESIRSELENQDKKVKYIPLEGAGHSLRKAEHIKTALEEEVNWYEAVINASNTGTNL